MGILWKGDFLHLPIVHPRNKTANWSSLARTFQCSQTQQSTHGDLSQGNSSADQLENNDNSGDESDQIIGLHKSGM